MVAKLTEGNELRVASAGFPVKGDTIYRIALRLKRQQDLRVYAHIQEVTEGQGGVEHQLFFWPGYALPPPEFMDLYSYFAPSATATTARLVVLIWPGENQKTGEASVQSLALTATGMANYPATASANFLINGACEAADAEGKELDWTNWGGKPPGNIRPGQGRNGTAAMALPGNYMLSQPMFLPVIGRRYRLGGWFKGAGTVSFELRGYHGWNIYSLGPMSGVFTAKPDQWQWFSTETIGLPGETQTAPAIFTSATTAEPILVDDLSLIEVGKH
jgi:hypothetical protein